MSWTESPENGHIITIKGESLQVPDDPIIPLIEGDGIGPDVTGAATRVLSAAVKHAYDGKRDLMWWKVPAGDLALKELGDMLPQRTLDAIQEHYVALKGPLTTPIGGGFRSLNVALRQKLEGVPSPMRFPERMDMVLFREATEDVYAGIEWKRGSEEAERFINLMKEQFDVDIRMDSGIGIKPISEFRTKRLVRKAVRYGLEKGRRGGVPGQDDLLGGRS
jgi:isocitrate dehydrogenase